MVFGGGLDHRGQHQFGHRDAGVPSAAGGSLARAGEQHDLALHDGGEMIFDRGVDVAHVEGHRQPAREGIEIAHVDLALARQLQLPLEAGCELAHHHGDENEQNEVEDLMRVGDAQAVERRIEEEGGGDRAGDGGHHRRDHAPARGRDHHRNEVDDRAVVQAGLRHQAIDKGRDEPDQHQRQADAAQFSLRRWSNLGASGIVMPAGGRNPFGRRNIRPPTLVCLLSRSCLSCPAWLHSGLFNRAFSGSFWAPERWQSG